MSKPYAKLKTAENNEHDGTDQTIGARFRGNRLHFVRRTKYGQVSAHRWLKSDKAKRAPSRNRSGPIAIGAGVAAKSQAAL
jgi:hypothetical protein